MFNLARTVGWTVGGPGRAASFGPSTISFWDQRATVEVSPCSEGGQGKDEAANCLPGNRTRDHWISRPERILRATGASVSAYPPVLGACAWAGCSGTRPIRPSLRARRPWANGVQLDSMTKSQRTKSQKTESQKTISQKTKSQMDKSQEDKSQIS